MSAVYVLAFNSIFIFCDVEDSNKFLGSLRWSYMLFQLIAYYTIHRGTQETLWEFISWTVIIFQNAAILEVSDRVAKKEIVKG
jgi:hypothetical protein